MKMMTVSEARRPPTWKLRANLISNDQPTCSGSFSTRPTRPWLHTIDVDHFKVHTSRVIGECCAISRRHEKEEKGRRSFLIGYLAEGGGERERGGERGREGKEID